ncbi:MAG: hypothetical protein ACLFRV_11765 [Acidimicrobiales bacterium]
MFDVHCDGHGDRTLLSTRAIEEVHQHRGRIELVLRCWCGHLLRHVTGRNADEGPPVETWAEPAACA